MKIEYNNLYTYFVFSTFERQAVIQENNRVRIEKYITGIVNNNSCKLYAIYVNPEHMHFLISRSPALSEEQLATIVADSSERFINQKNLPGVISHGKDQHLSFQYQNLILIKYVGIYLINPSIIKQLLTRRLCMLLTKTIWSYKCLSRGFHLWLEG